MQPRTLGDTGVNVSPFCLGAMMFGPWGNPDRDACVRIKPADAGYTPPALADPSLRRR